MSVCKSCGAATRMNYPLCYNCHKLAAQGATAQTRPEGAGPTPGPKGSPLDVPCSYEWTFGPMNGQQCGAAAGQNCTEGTFAPSIDIRMVVIGGMGYDVHEARFQAWKAQPVKLMYEGMEQDA